MLGFLQDIDVLGTLEAHLITTEVFEPFTRYKQRKRPFSNTEICLG